MLGFENIIQVLFLARTNQTRVVHFKAFNATNHHDNAHTYATKGS